MAINSRLVLNNDQFREALRQSSGAIGSMVADASTRFQTLYGQTDALNARLSRGIGRFVADLQSIGRSLAIGVSLPLLGLAGASLAAYGQIDSLKRGLFSIEKTAENTEARFNSLKEVAALPGLGLEEAVKGDIRLRAVGIAADLSKKSLLEFGNAIALTGGGKTDLDRVTVQLAQMSAKSKVLAQDLKPIIEAAPSVSQALQKMFGTVDSEEISKKLKAKGLNSTDFIGILVKEMEKLPRVSGGIKNAMENMGDSLKVAGFEFGLVLDKTLGLSEKLNGLGEFVGKAVKYFKELSPETQKLIITLGGIAIAAGPVLVAIGYLTSSTTFLAVGFGNVAKAAQLASAFIMANPYIILGVALVGLAAYLYSTSKAVDTLTSSQKANKEVNVQAQASVVAEGAKVNALIEITRSEVRSKEEKLTALNKLIAISPDYFGKLTLETVQTKKAEIATNEYTESLLKNALAKGAEAKMTQLGTQLLTEKEAFEEATKKAEAYKKVVEKGQMQNLGMGIFIKPQATKEFINQINEAKTKIQDTENAIKSLAQYTIIDEVKKPKKVTPDFTGGGGEPKAKKPDMVANPAKYFQNQYEDFKKDIQAFRSKINTELQNIKFDQKEFDLNFSIKPMTLDLSGIQRIKDILLSSGDLFPTTAIAKNFNQFDAIITQQAQKLYANTDLTLNEAKGKVAELWAGVGGAAKQAQNAILEGFATNVGAFLGGGQSLSSAISGIGASVLGGLGDFFISIGSQIVAAAPLFQAISTFLKTALTNPAAPALGLIGGLGLIALGAGMKALGSSLSSTTSSYTSGGGSGGGGGGGSGFSNPSMQGGGSQKMQPIEVLIRGESIARGSDIYTSYTNEKSYTSKVRRR